MSRRPWSTENPFSLFSPKLSLLLLEKSEQCQTDSPYCNPRLDVYGLILQGRLIENLDKIDIIYGPWNL